MTAAKEVLAEVQQIPLHLLKPNPLNPRQTFDKAALAELAQSIRSIGISQPLIVRQLEIPEGWNDGPRYEIVSGHRRTEAAALAEIKTVPCIVRELSDAEAADIALIDNLQHADVEALEEAVAFGELLTRLGSPEAIAARVGKEVSHIAKRLKLLALGLSSRDALREKLITVDHALLLARLGADEQAEALKWALDHNAGIKTPVEKVITDRVASRDDEKHKEHRYIWEPQSVLRLKEHIEQSSGRKLSRAPWDLDDAELVPAAGACTSCPSNTKANTALFADLDIEEATCADGACFENKRAAFVLIRLRTSSPDISPPLRVSWKQTSVRPRMDIVDVRPAPGGVINETTSAPDPKQIFKAGQWVEAKLGKTGCAHARPAITVDWSDDANRGYMGSGGKLRKPGELISVCITPKCKAHPKSYEQAAHSNGSSQKPGESWEVRQAREAKAAEAFKAAEGPVRRALYDAIVVKLTSEQIKRAVLGEVQQTHGIVLALGIDAKNSDAEVRRTIAAAGTMDLDKLLFHSQFGRELDPGGYEAQEKDKGRGKLLALAKIAGVKPEPIIARVESAQQVVAPKKDAPAIAKKSLLTPEAKKRIAIAQKKRWAVAKQKPTKPAARKAAKKGGAK